MKTAILGILSAVVLLGLAASAQARWEDYIPVDQCPPQGYENTGLRCLTHTIKKGETLSAIALDYSTRRHKITVSLLKEVNPSIRGDKIIAKRTMDIPYVHWRDLEQAEKMQALQEENWALEEENAEFVDTFANFVVVVEDFKQKNLQVTAEANFLFLQNLWLEQERKHGRALNTALSDQLDMAKKIMAASEVLTIMLEGTVARVRGENAVLQKERDELSEKLGKTTEERDWLFLFSMIFFVLIVVMGIYGSVHLIKRVLLPLPSRGTPGN